TTLPVLLFHQAREPEKYLRIDRNLIDQRVRAKKERLRSVIDYVNNDRVCKQRQLVEYFGQELKRDCGTCSVCRSRDRASKKDLTHSLMKILPLGQSMDLNELLGQFEPHDHESLIEIIRDGLESGSLVRQENDAILRKS
ncbi:MAG: RecQ family zinc-binding domain-containing protein, partial [Bacteroidota bacterium]|nr:RecQ family zinc-binding domain-containing protein [Bacteroidota bacterium]